MPDAGQLWERALSNFGKDVGEGISSAVQQYRKRHEQLVQFDAAVEELSRTPDPLDQTGKKMMLDPKSYERIKMLNEKHRYAEEQKLVESYKFANLFGMNAEKLDAIRQRQELNATRSDIAEKRLGLSEQQLEISKERQKTAEQKLIDIENKPSKGTEDWASAIPVARGTYDADTSTFTGDEKGDYYQLQTPAGKTLHVPIKEYEKQLKKISSPKSPRTLDSDKDEILQQALTHIKKYPGTTDAVKKRLQQIDPSGDILSKLEESMTTSSQ